MHTTLSVYDSGAAMELIKGVRRRADLSEAMAHVREEACKRLAASFCKWRVDMD